MKKALQVPKPLVSVNWLYSNLTDENLIIFDASIPKAGANTTDLNQNEQIVNALFFDIKNEFSDTSSVYPNTILSAEAFQEKAQEIGVTKDSCIVVYDDLGIYSSARVWWLFKTFGFENIAVLDGGLPIWKKANYPVENPIKRKPKKGNFEAVYQPVKFVNTQNVFAAINESFCIADARSKTRFLGELPEPREGLRSGHIPNSVSLPYTSLQNEDGTMKSAQELNVIFSEINPNNHPYIFTCGSGITACILALGLALVGKENYSVYDGSWTEWGSRIDLPIA